MTIFLPKKLTKGARHLWLTFGKVVAGIL